MPTPPQLTTEQRRQAAAKSLQLRRTRAQLKQMINAGELDIFGAFCQPDALGMKVLDLLMAMPGVGHGIAVRLLAEAGIPEKNTVRACGPTQRAKLFEAVRKRTKTNEKAPA